MLFIQKCCMMEASETYSALLGFFTDMAAAAAARGDVNPHMLKKGSAAGTPSPNVDSVTSRPDDEWLLQSFLVSEVECARDTAGSFLTSSLPTCPCLLSQCSRSRDVDAVGGTGNSLTSLDECERRRARRERNRIAAARCRDRRRMLTDTLQNESDHLEKVKAQLEQEIAGLEREKERLEIVLEAHKPACKMEKSDPETP